MVKFMNKNEYYEKLNELFDEIDEKLEDKFYDQYDALEWLSKNGYVKKVEVTYNQYYNEENDYLGDDYEDCFDVYEATLANLEYDKLEELLYDLKKQEQEGK